jgi:5-methylcytosine-specific restriction endonuclease McrA
MSIEGLRNMTKESIINECFMPIKPENRKLYPRDWKEIRAEVLEHAGNKCEKCGVPNHEWIERYSDGKWSRALGCGEAVESVYIILTIAHLDHAPTNNGVSGNRPNLAALCQRCHNRHDHKTRMKHAAETRRNKKATGNLF